MSKYNPPEFDKEIAQQVEAELKAKHPDNQWSPGYLIDIIHLCCNGNQYCYGHHGAFDLYLEKLNLNRNLCENCKLDFYSNELEDFCSENCELEYYD